ncbi:hypothetical protein HYW20_02920 [Candidatus Woesearchaeota archaeon]|nr:hypothetical protein [Candidatus Woesearchaeota archaeon]
MATLDRLMFTREHFPLDLEAFDFKGKNFWEFIRIEIPPYHPSMAKEGINFKSVPNLLYEAVEATVKDLEEIAKRRIDIQKLLENVRKDNKTKKILYEPEVVEEDDSGIKIGSIPLIDSVYVGKDNINPYDYMGGQGITIDRNRGAPFFKVPKKVTFTPELMSEYEMTDRGLLFGKKQIECSNGWHRHNLADINAIFYKNLVIALDNAVVREKYQKTSISEG